MKIYSPEDFIADDGSYEQMYQIDEWFEMQNAEKDTEIVYDKTVQRTAYIQANIVAVFEQWFKSFFDPNYFTFTRIRTQSNYSDFKSFMKKIYKQDKPFLVIDPHSPEHVEDSIFGLNMINRYNVMDPANDAIGATLLYSEPVIGTDKFELYYRRNTFRFEFDIMIMEQTLNRQINTYNKLLMSIRHNSKFSFERVIPSLIPTTIIKNIANLCKMDYLSQDFLEYLNTISRYPIIKRLIPNKQYLFFMQHRVMLNVEVPSYPSKDSVEMADQIEKGARIVDNFIFNVILPTEFLFLIPRKDSDKYIKGITEDPDAIYFISPVYSDIDIPELIGDYKLTSRTDISICHDDENSLNILELIEDIDIGTSRTVKAFLSSGGAINDIIRLSLYANGSYQEEGYDLTDTGIFSVGNPVYDKLYTLNLYLNLKLINTLKANSEKEYIGTIEK